MTEQRDNASIVKPEAQGLNQSNHAGLNRSAYLQVAVISVTTICGIIRIALSATGKNGKQVIIASQLDNTSPF